MMILGSIGGPDQKVRTGRAAFISITVLATLVLFPMITSLDVDGDGAYIPTVGVEIYEPGQNAVIAWDGNIERLFLSVNIYGEKDTDGFHVVPFPTEPEISEGSTDMFEELNKLVLEHDNVFKHRGLNSPYTFSGIGDSHKEDVVVTQSTKIGVHEVIVVRIDNPRNFREQLMVIVANAGMDIETWPEGLNEVIKEYCDRGITYFSIDHYPLSNIEATIEPVVYEFETEDVFFPLQISSILNAGARISLGIIHPKDIDLDTTCFKGSIIDEYTLFDLDKGDLKDLGGELVSFIGESAFLSFFQFKTNLKGLTGDVVMPGLRTISGRFDIPDLTIYYDDHFNYQIMDTGYYLLFDRYNDKRTICLDANDGDVKWIMDRSDEYLCTGRKLLPVRDAQGEFFPIFLDTAKANKEAFESYQRVYRIDPDSGDILWENRIENYYAGSDIFRTIRDHSGKEHIMMAGSGFIILDMDSGEMEERYLGLEGLSSLYQTYFIDTGKGEFIIFTEPYFHRSYCIDPFAPDLPEEYDRFGDPNSTYHDLEDISLTSLDGEILNAFFHNGTVIGWLREEDTKRDHFQQYDLLTGEFLGSVNHTSLPNLDPALFYDTDKDGKFEMIYVNQRYLADKICMNISCFNVEDMSKNWESSIECKEGPFGDFQATVIDLGGDGTYDLLVSDASSYQGQEIRRWDLTIALISLSNGGVIFNTTTRLDPHFGLRPYEVVRSIPVMNESGFYVFDPEKGVIGPFCMELCGPEDELAYADTDLFYVDLDGNGFKEIVLLNNYIDMGRIIHIDPYDDHPQPMEERMIGGVHAFMTLSSPAGEYILLSNRNMFLWISGSIDDDKDPIEVIQMDQENVIILSNPGDDTQGVLGTFVEEGRPIAAIVCVGVLNLLFLVCVWFLRIRTGRNYKESERTDERIDSNNSRKHKS